MSLSVSGFSSPTSYTPLPWDKAAAQNSGSSGPGALPDDLTKSSDPLVQNALSAIKSIEEIPDQIKARAKEWAKQELSQLLKVLRVTLQNSPSSVHALKDLAKGIASAAKDIAAGDKQTNDLSVQQTHAELDISIAGVQSTQTTALATANNADGSSASLSVASQTQAFSIHIHASIDTQTVVSAEDSSQLGEASKAIAQIKAAIERAAHNRGDKANLLNAVNGVGNDLRDAINGLANDAATALAGLSTASLTQADDQPIYSLSA